MTNWVTVHDSRPEQPETLDKTSSSAVIYQRRNIHKETRTEQDGAEVEEWVYEQRELTHEEYGVEEAEQLRADVDYLLLIGGIE